MSILGNNLLAQYYAQNQFKYIDNPELWIEADSWGETVWTNKGNGGYDLSCVSSYHGVKEDNKIIASSSNCVAYCILRNVLGTGSFTVEAIVRPDESMATTQYGGWLVTERTSSQPQPSSLQIYFSQTKKYSISGWNAQGENLAANWISTPYDTSFVSYYCFGYDTQKQCLFKQCNNNINIKENISLSVQINKFAVFNNGNFIPNQNGSNMFFYGDIYSLRVYQRALPRAERANNMRHDKARFNF